MPEITHLAEEQMLWSMTFYKNAICRKKRDGRLAHLPVVASGWVLPLGNGAGLPALPFAPLCCPALAIHPGQAAQEGKKNAAAL